MQEVYNLDFPHNYLEMARSVFTGIHDLNSRKPPKSGIRKSIRKIIDIFSRQTQNTGNKEYDSDQIMGIIFTMTSVTIVYSYMAIESFINYHLYQIWTDSRYFHDQIEKINKIHPELNSVAKYAEFYRKYGKYKRFERLKTTDLNGLKVRIKVVCEELGIKQIHEANDQLWKDFLSLCKVARNFLIHPFPDQAVLQEIMSQILVRSEGGLYVNVAAGMIKHFYDEKGDEPPEWLERNVSFNILGFEYIS